MGVIKNMLEDIEVENYIDSQSGIYDDSEQPLYDKHDEEMQEIYESERKADEYYQSLLEEERNSTAHEFPGYNPNNVPKFTNVPTLGGCLSYLLFSGIGLLIMWLIAENL